MRQQICISRGWSPSEGQEGPAGDVGRDRAGRSCGPSLLAQHNEDPRHEPEQLHDADDLAVLDLERNILKGPDVVVRRRTGDRGPGTGLGRTWDRGPETGDWGPRLPSAVFGLRSRHRLRGEVMALVRLSRMVL